MPINLKQLVPGAKVTIEGTVESTRNGAVTYFTEMSGHYTILVDDPAILSVTPPPVDWSKVRRAVFQGEAGDIVAVDGNAAWIRFDRGGNKILALSSLSPLVSLPDTDDAQAECDEYRKSDQSSERRVYDTPDTRPAWQRARVGDKVRHRDFGICRVIDTPNWKGKRLYLGGRDRWFLSNNSDILEIVRTADANR